jgi:hypothetical protein
VHCSPLQSDELARNVPQTMRSRQIQRVWRNARIVGWPALHDCAALLAREEGGAFPVAPSGVAAEDKDGRGAHARGAEAAAEGSSSASGIKS